MANILYQLYNVPLSSSLNKDVNKELKKQPFRYALVRGNRISFSNKPGLSFQDICIDQINESSFVFISKQKNNKLFLLIYVKNTVIFSGLTEENQLENIINLYKSKVPDDTEYFVDHFHKQFDFLTLSKPFSPTLTGIEENTNYVLIDIKTISEKMNQRYRLIAIGTILIALVIGLCYMVGQYISYRKHQAEMDKQQEVLNIWKGYDEAIQGSALNTELNSVIHSIRTATTLPSTAVKKINYTGPSLTIHLANANYPTMLLNTWAEKHRFFVTDFNANSITLHKTIQITAAQPKGIMNAIKIKAWLIDQLHMQFPRIIVTFNGTEQKSNFCIIPITLSFENTPIAIITQFFDQTHNLPLRLTTLDGSVTLGNFTGTISFNVIGDQS